MSKKRQLTEIIEQAVFASIAEIAQGVVAKITVVNETTINCKPVINKIVNGAEIEMPEFTEVPPVFLNGGDSYEAYPLKVDDYCILLISERCFDLWYEGQDFRPPAEIRMHDYSDAFALVGLRNRSGAITIPSDDRIWQIGDKYKEGDHEHLGDLVHNGNTTQTGDYTQDGDYNLTGNVEHTGNTNQTGNTTVSGTMQAATVAAGAGGFTAGGVSGFTGSVSPTQTAIVINGIITQAV